MRDLIDETGARVVRLQACGMVTVRGTLADPAFVAALDSCGVSVPAQRLVAPGAAGLSLWMSRDELLLQCAAGDDRALAQQLGTALAGQHHLAVAVGDARARFAVTGPKARVALAKLTPVDMARFEQGEVRRTRLAQIPAAFWMTEPEAFELVCFRSVAVYAHGAIAAAARHLDGIALP